MSRVGQPGAVVLGQVVVLGQDRLLDQHGLGLGRVQPGVLGVGQGVVVVVMVRCPW